MLITRLALRAVFLILTPILIFSLSLAAQTGKTKGLSGSAQVKTKTVAPPLIPLISNPGLDRENKASFDFSHLYTSSVTPVSLPEQKFFQEAVDIKAELLSPVRSTYTEEAKTNRIEGIVKMRVLVGIDGVVKQVRITRGLPDGLSEKAVTTAYELLFRPAIKDNKQVQSWFSIEIEFSLEEH